MEPPKEAPAEDEKGKEAEKAADQQGESPKKAEPSQDNVNKAENVTVNGGNTVSDNMDVEL